MIEKERIEHIKTTVDLKSYIAQSIGSTFKKNGKGYVCRCPFPDHEDKTPSFIVTPSENLFHCFGCNRGGDIFKFDQIYFNLDFTESVKKHENGSSSKKPTTKKKPPAKQKIPNVKERKLLARVHSYYQHTLTEDTAGIDYLKNERGINDNRSLKDFGVGYANGTLLKILPAERKRSPAPGDPVNGNDNGIIQSLKNIGILNSKGKEVFYNCVVFPLYDSKGSIVSLYGRNIDAGCEVSHLYLPGKRCGLVNRQAAIRSQTLILTESIIDALTLYDQGFKNVMPIYGVNGLIDDHLSFFNRPAGRGICNKIKEAYLVFDADDAGRRAAKTVSLQLKEKEIVPHIVELPAPGAAGGGAKDVNVYFNRHTPEEFEALLKTVKPKSITQSGTDNKKKTLYKHTDHGFIVGYGSRQYEAKGIRRGDTQLKVALKASLDVEANIPFELATIDLYSSRSRTWYAKLCAPLFGVAEELLKEDMAKLLTLIEQYEPRQESKDTIEITKQEREDAIRFLKDPEMFEQILCDLEIMGIVGEDVNKIVSYLVATSRKLDKPLSALIQSRSGAGKSTVQNKVLLLVPDEDRKVYTRVTDQSLYYKEEDDLAHKVLALEEEAGMGGAAYAIRNIQSAGEINIATTGKDPATGKMKTYDYTVKGPVAVMVTTTATDLDQETASRFMFLSIDESSEATLAIHKKQGEQRTLEGLINKKKKEKIKRKHHTAQRLLRPLHVVNPYVRYLSYPTKSLTARRDHEKYLGLIDVIAFLHQYQRKIKTMEIDGEKVRYIEVTIEDIGKANTFANEVLGQSLDDLSRPSRILLKTIYKMVKEISDKTGEAIDKVSFNRRMIREYIGWSDWQVRAHIKQLEDLEYVYIRIGARGKEYTYALNYQGQVEKDGKCYLNLTTVEKIIKQVKKDQGDK